VLWLSVLGVHCCMVLGLSGWGVHCCVVLGLSGWGVHCCVVLGLSDWGMHCCMQCMSLLNLRYRTIHMCKSKYSMILKNLSNDY